MHELPLVFLTVLAQSAVGLFIALGFVEMVARPDEKAMTRSFMASLVLLGVAATASVTHLGQPFRMFNVMFGLQHASALSLEIVALSLFGGAGAAYTGLRLFNWMPAIRKWLLPVAMILGVVFILAFVNVYTLKTVPTWNSGWTLFQFFMTAAVVGPVAASAILRWQAGTLGAVQATVDKVLASFSLLSLIISMVGFAGYLFWLGQLQVHGNPLAVMGYHQILTMVRIALLTTGVIIPAVSAMRGNHKATGITVFGFLMVLVAELMGRVFFYDIYISASSGM
jgi:anaerobic dimethyl sulfoxide reductase subunit C (anchor subunit)/Tat-targeted selenate reductase subunit YnfH